MNWKAAFVPVLLVAVSGCALLQRADDDSDGSAMMMTADIVPLPATGQQYTHGEPMAVPDEPPPFPQVKGRYVGMQSDLEAERRAATGGGEEPDRIPREPIP